MRQLINHNSEQTCLLLKDYPFHFGAYTCVKYWIETNKSYGQRVMHQFMDPKTSLANPKWHKPKASPFFDIVVMQMQDNPAEPQYGIVSFIEFDFAGKVPEEVQGFSEYFYFDEFQRDILLTEFQTRRHLTYRTNFKNTKPQPWTPLELRPTFSVWGQPQPLPMYPDTDGINPLFAGEINNDPAASSPGCATAQPIVTLGQHGGIVLRDYQDEAKEALREHFSAQNTTDAAYAAAELIVETWVAWPWDRANADPEGAAAHVATRNTALRLLGKEIPGSTPVTPVTNSDLKRGG